METDGDDKQAIANEKETPKSQLDSYHRFLQQVAERERGAAKCGGKTQQYIEKFCKRDERLTPAVARLKILFQPGAPVWYTLESVAGVVVLHPCAEMYASSVVIKWPDESFQCGFKHKRVYVRDLLPVKPTAPEATPLPLTKYWFTRWLLDH